MSGYFLVLEGIDGAGTTTQAACLKNKFTALGAQVLQTNQPSGGAIGVRIREFLRAGAAGNAMDPHALALLFAADRMDHLAQEIGPALARGSVVVCDRYVLSSLAYQGAFVDVEWVAALNAHARRPDLTLFVDVDVTVARARRAARGLPVDQYEVDEVQSRVRKNYQGHCHRADLGPVCVVDGSGSIDTVTAALWAVVESRWRP